MDISNDLISYYFKDFKIWDKFEQLPVNWYEGNITLKSHHFIFTSKARRIFHYELHLPETNHDFIQNTSILSLNFQTNFCVNFRHCSLSIIFQFFNFYTFILSKVLPILCLTTVLLMWTVQRYLQSKLRIKTLILNYLITKPLKILIFEIYLQLSSISMKDRLVHYIN